MNCLADNPTGHFYFLPGKYLSGMYRLQQVSPRKASRPSLTMIGTIRVRQPDWPTTSPTARSAADRQVRLLRIDRCTASLFGIRHQGAAVYGASHLSLCAHK
jgi:hypothetical protein